MRPWPSLETCSSLFIRLHCTDPPRGTSGWGHWRSWGQPQQAVRILLECFLVQYKICKFGLTKIISYRFEELVENCFWLETIIEFLPLRAKKCWQARTEFLKSRIIRAVLQGHRYLSSSWRTWFNCLLLEWVNTSPSSLHPSPFGALALPNTRVAARLSPCVSEIKCGVPVLTL